MGHESYARGWADSARRAGFLPFEVVHPEPTETRVSGHGGGSNGRLHCAIAHTIDGEEIFIQTIVGDDPDADDDPWTRREILGVVQSLLEGEVTLPFRLDLTFQERSVEVLVDGVSVTFKGIEGAGLNEWQLRADIDPRTVVVIQGRTGSSAPTAIRRRQDLRIGYLADA